MKDLIDAHLEWCQAARYSPNTTLVRGQVLRAAQRDIQPNGLLATDREVARWIGNPDWEATTASTYYSHLDAFFSWAVEQGELDWSPMKRLRRPRVPTAAPDPWTDEQLAKLLRCCAPRFRLAVVLASYAGLRCCEIIKISPRTATEHVIRVRGKGGKTAEIETHPRVWRELSPFPGTDPYIVQAGGRADARWLSRAAREHFHGIGVPVHLHQGRHWYTTGVYEAEGEAAAQQAARHSSIVSTMGYTQLRNGQRRRGILALPVLDETAS